jgi:hypothetical protein
LVVLLVVLLLLLLAQFIVLLLLSLSHVNIKCVQHTEASSRPFARFCPCPLARCQVDGVVLANMSANGILAVFKWYIIFNNRVSFGLSRSTLHLSNLTQSGRVRGALVRGLTKRWVDTRYSASTWPSKYWTVLSALSSPLPAPEDPAFPCVLAPLAELFPSAKGG